MTPASLRGKPLSELKKHLNACGSAAFIEFSAVPSNGYDNTSRIIARTCRRIIRLQTHPLSDLLLQAALEIHRNTPSLVLPFLKTASHLPHSRNRILPWLQKLKNLTIAVPAIAKLLIEKTPAAIEIFGGECLENWTRMAVDAAAGKLDDEGIAAWVSRGAAINLGEPALFNYFLGASAESEKTISALLPKMRLDDSRRLLSLLCKALLDREVSIKSNSALHGVKGFSGGAATDGQTLFLPERAANFETFKLMALHQSYSTP